MTTQALVTAEIENWHQIRVRFFTKFPDPCPKKRRILPWPPLARIQPVHYQQMDSTTGVIFIQGFVSIKIQRIIWKPHGVSMGYQRFCSGQTIDKEHKKIVKVQMMFQYRCKRIGGSC